LSALTWVRSWAMSSRWRSFWESLTEQFGAGPSSSAKALATVPRTTARGVSVR